MKVYEMAHARTGDKGNISIISIIAYNKEDYVLLKNKITEQRVKSYLHKIAHGKVTRYTLDNIHALNFVLEDALGGGVTKSLALDMHGKTLGAHLLEMEI